MCFQTECLYCFVHVIPSLVTIVILPSHGILRGGIPYLNFSITFNVDDDNFITIVYNVLRSVHQ